MTPRMNARIQGTQAQQTAQTLRALANYSLSLQRNTRLNAEQRLQALKAMACR